MRYRRLTLSPEKGLGKSMLIDGVGKALPDQLLEIISKFDGKKTEQGSSLVILGKKAASLYFFQ
jgi:hypothetical protein